jgi:peptidoglycan LD-endopeptidase CwlK
MATWINTPKPLVTGVHSKFGGVTWRTDAAGMYVENATMPERSAGVPATCFLICKLFEKPIIERAIEFNIAPELIVMTIATEASAYRNTNFTGPPTFRWEAHVKVKDAPPLFMGDYSIGPMQTLATTARDVIKRLALPYDALANFPAYRSQPITPPSDIPGYEAAVNIHVGVGEIASRLALTAQDPILVAAAYNAGSIYDSSAPTVKPIYKNRWNLRSHGNHLDRAAQWYGDACEVISSLRIG